MRKSQKKREKKKNKEFIIHLFIHIHYYYLLLLLLLLLFIFTFLFEVVFITSPGHFLLDFHWLLCVTIMFIVHFAKFKQNSYFAYYLSPCY